MFFLLLLALDEVQGTIAAAEGEAIVLNLKGLADDVSKIRVNGQTATSWTPEVKGEVRIEAPDLRVVLEVLKPSRRVCAIQESGGRVAITSEWAEGDWKIDAGGGDYKISTADDKLTVNGVELAQLDAIARSSKSSFHLVRPSALKPWLAVAEKYYQALMDDDFKAFASCYNKNDRDQSERYASVQLHWKAGRRLVQQHKLKGYVYDYTDERFTKETQRKVFFRRMSVDGKQIGMSVPLTLVIEDDAWVIYLASQ